MGNQLSETHEYRPSTYIQKMIPAKLMAHLDKLDWTLLQGSAVISIGMLVARGLAFFFYLILARSFAPGAYGEIQYSIAVAEVMTIGTQPFGQHVLARFIGQYKEAPDDLNRILSNAWVILAGVCAATLAVAILVLNFASSYGVAVLVVVAGTTIFYVYWGVARGFMMSGRLVVAYLGSNLLQLILTFGLIQFLDIKSISLALMIYGGSYLLPLLLLQIFGPLHLPFSRHLVNWSDIRTILGFSFPIWLSHAMYMFNLTLDFLLLKRFSDVETLGQYSLAKNISVLFIFIPSAISTVLMPRIASVPEKEHKKLLIQSLALSLTINFGILVALLLLGEWAVRQFFGAEYLSSPVTVLILSIGMIVLGTHAIFSSVLVGKGRASWETMSRLVILVVFATVGWLIIPMHDGLGAAITVFVGGVSGILSYGILLFLYKRAT